jgi:hypothetical protein
MLKISVCYLDRRGEWIGFPDLNRDFHYKTDEVEISMSFEGAVKNQAEYINEKEFII